MKVQDLFEENVEITRTETGDRIYSYKGQRFLARYIENSDSEGEPRSNHDKWEMFILDDQGKPIERFDPPFGSFPGRAQLKSVKAYVDNLG